MNEQIETPAKKRRVYRSEESWREIIRNQEQSGLSQEAFCQREKIAESRLHTWRKKLGYIRRKKQASVGFVEMNPRPANRNEHSYEIQVSNGRALRLGSGFNASEVQELLKIMEG